MRLVERKVELCVAVEAVEREPRARAPIAVDAAEIAAELRKLDEHVLRELLARGALGQRRLGGLFSFRRGLFGVLAFGGGDLCAVLGRRGIRRWRWRSRCGSLGWGRGGALGWLNATLGRLDADHAAGRAGVCGGRLRGCRLCCLCLLPRAASGAAASCSCCDLRSAPWSCLKLGDLLAENGDLVGAGRGLVRGRLRLRLEEELTGE